MSGASNNPDDDLKRLTNLRKTRDNLADDSPERAALQAEIDILRPAVGRADDDINGNEPALDQRKKDKDNTTDSRLADPSAGIEKSASEAPAQLAETRAKLKEANLEEKTSTGKVAAPSTPNVADKGDAGKGGRS